MLSSYSNQIFIVSKPIFEVPDEIILKQTLKHKNLNYIIIVDDHVEKSLNKERDDFVCIFLHHLKKDRSFIITNDRYNNYHDIIKTIKPVTLKFFKEGKFFFVKLDEKLLINIREEILSDNFFPTRKAFSFGN
jgi:hypothetical protein